MPERRAVLVTGTSTGIGHACALRLAREGFLVFAGVRRLADGEALVAEAGPAIVPVLLDVTDAAGVAEAARRVAERLTGERGDGGAGLAGLVNNAGIGLSGPMEYLPLDDIRRLFEVNVFGQVAVTQAFLPLLRAARGRVVNIGSVGDRITIPFGGALCGSKCAFAALTEALRLELRPWGLHVALVEPASIATPAVDKTLGDADALLRRMPAGAERRYGAMFRRFAERAAARERRGSAPDVVAGAVLHALTSARPRLRYPVGKDAAILVSLPRLVPGRILDRIRLRRFGLPARFGALAGAGG